MSVLAPIFESLSPLGWELNSEPPCSHLCEGAAATAVPGTLVSIAVRTEQPRGTLGAAVLIRAPAGQCWPRFHRWLQGSGDSRKKRTLKVRVVGADQTSVS